MYINEDNGVIRRFFLKHTIQRRSAGKARKTSYFSNQKHFYISDQDLSPHFTRSKRSQPARPPTPKLPPLDFFHQSSHFSDPKATFPKNNFPTHISPAIHAESPQNFSFEQNNLQSNRNKAPASDHSNIFDQLVFSSEPVPEKDIFPSFSPSFEPTLFYTVSTPESSFSTQESLFSTQEPTTSNSISQQPISSNLISRDSIPQQSIFSNLISRDLISQYSILPQLQNTVEKEFDFDSYIDTCLENNSSDLEYDLLDFDIIDSTIQKNKNIEYGFLQGKEIFPYAAANSFELLENE